jgi:hypothetical protein
VSEHQGGETGASTRPGSPAPGERRLDRPPSDRYRTVEPEPIEGDPNASPVRGAALGAAAAAIGAGAIVLLGGVLTVTSGLIVAAGAIGWVVGLGVRLGTGATLDRSSRVRLAVGLAVLAVVAGQLGLWAYARSEGGVLGPVDYLAEVFGLLVPLELIVAWLVAWVTSR